MATYDASSRYQLDTSKQTASRKPIGPAQYTVYVTKEYDTLERIAANHLGSDHRYWEIADINPQIKFPLDLEVGTVLRLPV